MDDARKDEQRRLADYERQLEEADLEAQRAIKRRDSLRQVVLGLRAYLDIDVQPKLWATAADFGDVDPVVTSVERVDEHGTSTATGTQTGSKGVSGDTPRGREAVELILSDSGREMHIEEIVRDALGRGWMRDVSSPRNALSAAAKRLVLDGKIEKAGRARYRFPKNRVPLGAGSTERPG